MAEVGCTFDDAAREHLRRPVIDFEDGLGDEHSAIAVL